MKILNILCLVSLFWGVTHLGGCYYLQRITDEDQALYDKIQAAFAEEGPKEVMLSELYPEEWNTVCDIAHYGTAYATLGVYFGFEQYHKSSYSEIFWSPLRFFETYPYNMNRSDFAFQENRNGLAFISGREVQLHVMSPNVYYGGSGNCLARREAVLRNAIRNDGTVSNIIVLTTK